MKRRFLVLGLVLLGSVLLIGLRTHDRNGSRGAHISSVAGKPSGEKRDMLYESSGLMTNTAIHSIDLALVLDGGPGKDGIPALNQPAFTTIAAADPSIKDDVDGILVSVGTSARFYPYNILVWHEVVNDTLAGKHLVITFCPLCGSAIVYDAGVNGTPETFGVSGKLYNSNLLMYDRTTESLWSQIEGKAVVGDRTGAALALYPSNVLSFAQVKKSYPAAEILSVATGYRRDYSFYPYGDYNTSQTLYFPVAVHDTRLPAKEIMYVVNYGGRSVALKVKDLAPGTHATIRVGDRTLTAKLVNGEITVTAPDGTTLPGYTLMWFSWAVYHQKDGVVWTARASS